MSELIEIAKNLNKDVVKRIMEDNGAKLYQEKVDELWYNTICHGGDSHKLCYYDNNKIFYCYTNCGQMSIFDLISKVRNCTFYEAVCYLKNFLGIHNTNRKLFGNQVIIDEEEEKIWEDSYNISEKIINNPQINEFYDKRILNRFEDIYYLGWIEQGINIETMEKFQIKWYEEEKHIIIPHFNYNGELIGIRRRSLKPEDSNNKYMPETIHGITYKHSLGLNLYGIYENKKAINKNYSVYIVEGEKSVMLSNSWYGDNSIAVATCGFNLSNAQINLLRNICEKITTVFICYDKDFDVVDYFKKYKKGEPERIKINNYIKKINDIVHKLEDYYDVYVVLDRNNLLDLKDSPFDKGKEVFEKLRANVIKGTIQKSDISSKTKKV